MAFHDFRPFFHGAHFLCSRLATLSPAWPTHTKRNSSVRKCTLSCMVPETIFNSV